MSYLEKKNLDGDFALNIFIIIMLIIFSATWDLCVLIFCRYRLSIGTTIDYYSSLELIVNTRGIRKNENVMEYHIFYVTFVKTTRLRCVATEQVVSICKCSKNSCNPRRKTQTFKNTNYVSQYVRTLWVWITVITLGTCTYECT